MHDSLPIILTVNDSYTLFAVIFYLYCSILLTPRDWTFQAILPIMSDTFAVLVAIAIILMTPKQGEKQIKWSKIVHVGLNPTSDNIFKPQMISHQVRMAEWSMVLCSYHLIKALSHNEFVGKVFLLSSQDGRVV